MKLPHSNSFALVYLSCCLGFTLFGIDSSLMSGVLPNKVFKDDFNNPDATVVGQITSSFDLGCFITAVITSIIGNSWSRKKTITIGCLIHVIGGIIQASSFSVGQLIAGRVIAGLGNGFITVAIPVWLSECTPAGIRGQTLGFVAGINGIGGVIIAWINFGMMNVTSSVAWRFPVSLQVLFSAATMIITPFLAESPRWLIIQGRADEAREVIAGLLNKPLDSDDVHTMFVEIKYHVEHEMELASESHFRDLFKGGDKMKNLERILLGAGSQFMQQWGGINVILYYATVIFEDSLGLSSSLAYILSACNQMNSTICELICSFFLIDRMGRKPIIFWGAFAQGICFVLVIIGLSIGTQSGSIIAVAFMFAYYTSYGLSWWMVPWMYPAEINSLRYRNTGAAVATATNWIFNYVIVLITPTGIANIGWRYYIIYAVMNFAAMPVIYFFYEETSELTLEQVDELFEFRNGKRSYKEIIPGAHRKRKLWNRTIAVNEPKNSKDEFVENVDNPAA
ncbi:hexose transporter Hxt10p [Trichomonascus vanleenenianus]|uniref:hexose transporter Hxt10p n=1 Tax=Trichomonascus vanleenenianus TaxID=2268995 RepID=UPI003ECA1AA4